MTTKSLLSVFLFSFSLCDLKKEYATRLRGVPPIFQNIFEFSLTQKELVEYYTKQMGNMADQEFNLGSTLSEVLISYFTFNTFSRKSGNEISEQDFLRALSDQLRVLVASRADEQIDAMGKGVISNANGLIKASRNFDAAGIIQGGKMVESIISANPNLPEKNKKKISELSQFFSRTVRRQQTYHSELENFKQNSKDIFNLLIFNLVLASYQPNVDLMGRMVIRLRVLELAEALRILFHYDRLDVQAATERNDNLMISLAKLKVVYDTEFRARNSQKMFQLKENQILSTLAEENRFLELLKIRNKDSMVTELNRLRIQMP